MKYLFAILLVVVTLTLAVKVTAQDPPPDFGETNLLLIACNSMWDAATNQEFVVKNCRRAAPDEVNGYRAVIHVRLMTHVGPVYLAASFYKSLWSISTAVQEYPAKRQFILNR